MTDIRNPVDVAQQTRKIKLSTIVDYVRFATEHGEPMFNCLKPIIDVSHMPMQIFHSLVTSEMIEERCKHALLEVIVMIFDSVECNPLELCDLVNRKRYRLGRIELA